VAVVDESRSLGARVSRRPPRSPGVARFL
jgi:hypothetical protein